MSIGVASVAPLAEATLPATTGYELAVIVPTFNEADNVAGIVASLDAALDGIRAEIIFVDDWSQDGTADRVQLAAAGRSDIRVIRRYGRNGLSSAVIEGMMATMAPVVAVIDGDGQHDERLLPRLFAEVAEGGADVAIGSRYCDQGSTGEWDSMRLRFSQWATGLSRLVLQSPVKDPMSGFFAVRRDKVEAMLPHLSSRGFKILFDLLTSSPEPLRAVELPFQFRSRTAGESKLGTGVVIDYLITIADRLLRRYMPPRFVMFAAVGTVGLALHYLLLHAMLGVGAHYRPAQAAAMVLTIAFNFVVNNAVTFRDRRLRKMRFYFGMASFYAVCGLGALADIGTGSVLFAQDHRGWVPAIAGAVVGTLWNYAASSLVTWRKR